MKDVDRILAVQTIAREIPETDPGAMECIAEELPRRIAVKLASKISDGRTYAVALMPQETRDNLFTEMIDVRQQMNVRRIINCAECKYNPWQPRPWDDDDIIDHYAWCEAFVSEGGFCPYGKENKSGGEDDERMARTDHRM